MVKVRTSQRRGIKASYLNFKTKQNQAISKRGFRRENWNISEM